MLLWSYGYFYYWRLLLNISYELDIVPTLYLLFYLILSNNLWDRYHFYYCIEEETQGSELLYNLFKIIQLVFGRARTELRSLWLQSIILSGKTLPSTFLIDMWGASVLELKISSTVLYLLKINLVTGAWNYLQNIWYHVSRHLSFCYTSIWKTFQQVSD